MATLAVTPTRVRSRARGVVLSLTGAGTTWLTSAPVFTASSGTIRSQAVTADNTAALTYDAPPNSHDVTLTDPTTGATCVLTVRVPPSRRWFPARHF